MATPNQPSPHPQLQPAGTGLPWWEYLAARYIIFPRTCRSLSWAAASQLFQEEGSRVLTIWESIPPDKRATRILVPRSRGMEDSSRYWSAAMTLEHLVPVGHGIRAVINALRNEQTPPQPATIEGVKPKGEIPPERVHAAFMQLLKEAETRQQDEPAVPPGIGPRFAHPWFGEIDAHQWHCLLGIHQGIHRKQLEAIRQRL